MSQQAPESAKPPDASTCVHAKINVYESVDGAPVEPGWTKCRGGILKPGWGVATWADSTADFTKVTCQDCLFLINPGLWPTDK